jgi:hypothetical protein
LFEKRGKMTAPETFRLNSFLLSFFPSSFLLSFLASFLDLHIGGQWCCSDPAKAVRNQMEWGNHLLGQEWERVTAWPSTSYLEQDDEAKQSLKGVPSYLFFFTFLLAYISCTGARVHCDIYTCAYNVSYLDSSLPSFSLNHDSSF